MATNARTLNSLWVGEETPLLPTENIASVLRECSSIFFPYLTRYFRLLNSRAGRAVINYTHSDETKRRCGRFFLRLPDETMRKQNIGQVRWLVLSVFCVRGLAFRMRDI